MTNNKLRYIMYLRKSTDDDRQVQSIEDQEKALQPTIKSKGLNVIKTFSEARSAKQPGRKEFNTMVQLITDGKADSIICWKINRLVRNPVDAGEIQWLLQRGILKSIITHEREYLPADNVLMMAVETGMANQFVLDLSRDVRRGMKSKAEKGWRPSQAPLGYLNDKLGEQGEKKIYTDQDRFSLVRKLWDLLLTGNYTVPVLVNVANDKLGLRTKRGKKISLGSLYHLFADRFYYGEYAFDGEVYEGKHKSMITAEEFDRAQQILGRAGRPRPKTKRLPFTGLIECADCGRMISCYEKVKRIKSTGKTKGYIYHRCTRKTKDNPCGQKQISHDSLIEQVTQQLRAITIPPEFLEWAVQSLREQQKLEETNRNTILTNLRNNHQNTIDRIDRLVNLYISPENSKRELLSEEELKRQKNTLLKEKADIEREMLQVNRRVNEWVDLTIKSFNFATYASAWFEKGDYETKTAILRALGQSFVLKDRKLLLNLKNPYVVIQKGVADGLFENMPRELFKTATKQPLKAREAAIVAREKIWSG